MSRAAAEVGGVSPSPNIWNSPAVYEWENEAFDPEQLVESAICSLQPPRGGRVLDIGCGSGFHLPWWSRAGARVVGLEPHPPLAQLAAQRTRGMSVTVVGGEAGRLPFAADTFDLVLARWAYFFGPGCEPGLDQVERVLRPGGVAAFLDNDVNRSTFGSWFRDAHPAYDPAAVERFWGRKGFAPIRIHSRWECPDRARFEAIIGIEFDSQVAARILANHPGMSVDYAVTLWWRRY